MLNNAENFNKIYMALGYTDLRCGIDGLATKVQSEFNLSPFEENVLFMFCGHSNSKIKCLVWEGDGFLLLYKRLEAGKFKWPRTEQELKVISNEQFGWLMKGLQIEPNIQKIQPKKIF